MTSLPTPKPGTGLNTIAFDLDGTLAEPTWPSPEIGVPIQKAVDAMLEYARQGYEVIIFTSRPASHRLAIQNWLSDEGLVGTVYDIVTDKPRAAMYVDDRAVTFPEAFEAPSGNGVFEPAGDVTFAKWLDEDGKIKREDPPTDPYECSPMTAWDALPCRLCDGPCLWPYANKAP